MWSDGRGPNKAGLTRQLKAGALMSAIVVVAACGGGSSGGSPTPPPSSPAPPPPSVAFDLSETTVMSGATFNTSVNGEVDGRVTFTIGLSCTNGVTLEDMRDYVRFTVPQASELLQARCTATVADSRGRSASDSFPITVLPKTDIGQVVGIFNPSLKLLSGNFNTPGNIDTYGTHVLAVAESATQSGRFRVRGIEGTSVSPRQYHRDDIVLVEGEFAGVDFVQSPSLYAHGLPEASLSIASSSENKIHWLIQEPQSQDFSVQETIDVESPCFLEQTNTYWANDLVVGQRNRGLSVFDIDTGSDLADARNFNATLVYNVGGQRSLCYMLRGVIPPSIQQQYPDFRTGPPTGQSFSSPLTAIDYNTNELVFYGDANSDNRLDELGVMPIETHAASHLNIVQVIARGSSTQGPQYLIVLLSDGRPMGEHRIVQINFDFPTGEISQRIVHEWSEGVPVSMMQGPLGGSMELGLYRPDLVVVLGTTEMSFFFDNLLPAAAGFGQPPLYGEPRLFKVGVGAGSAVAAVTPFGPSLSWPDYGVLVSYPASGRVVYISL
jgi:hypothetical protein